MPGCNIHFPTIPFNVTEACFLSFMNDKLTGIKIQFPYNIRGSTNGIFKPLIAFKQFVGSLPAISNVSAYRHVLVWFSRFIYERDNGSIYPIEIARFVYIPEFTAPNPSAFNFFPHFFKYGVIM